MTILIPLACLTNLSDNDTERTMSQIPLTFILIGNSGIHTSLKWLYWFMKSAFMSIPLTKYRSKSLVEGSFQCGFIRYHLDKVAIGRVPSFITLFNPSEM